MTGGGGMVRLASSNPRLTAPGGFAETAGYATARERFTISVDTAAGTITIR